MKPQVTTADVYAALEKRCETRSWAVFKEVSNSTGWAGKRYADMLALSLWPSRGLELHGFEIKVSRTDWLRELKKPKKADEIQRFCDRWWVAAGDASIVKDGELPPTWGLLVLTGSKLTCKVDAPQLTPEILDRGFVAALLRRASDSAQELERQAHRRGFQEGSSQGPEVHQRTLASLRMDVEGLEKRIQIFEEKSGVQIDAWRPGDVGKAVRTVLELRHRREDSDGCLELERAAQYLGHMQKMIDGEVAAMRKAREQARKAIDAAE